MNKQQTLLKHFIEFNRNKRLAGPKKRVLLAVSGGKDSVVMCDLFSKASWPFSIAHCNFQLRGEESNTDETFVQALGKQYNVEVFVRRFDTTSYAEEKKTSIQIAARELRYKWFEELRVAENFQLIATAHHLNDNIETILLNLVKGSGIRGLRGIPLRQATIIRPLLFASQQEIELHVKEFALHFREDSSNATDKYTRNKIRHHVIPLLKEINPSLEKTLGEKVELFTELEQLYDQNIRKKSKQLFLKRGADIYIPLLLLKKTQNAASVLFEYLKDFDFTPEQIADMLAGIDAPPGGQYLTGKMRIIKDRRFYIMTGHEENEQEIHRINELDTEISIGDKKIFFTPSLLTKREKNVALSNKKNIAFIDSAKLEFPLLVRRWKAGDYFYPLGMKLKKKKVKKFLTDEKVPLHEKEKVWVIESNQKIVWVIGYRIDERFKLSDKTTNALRIEWK